jgi:hypothetical protein
VKKKVYLNRSPKVGDMVESVSNPFEKWEHKVGYEYKITKLGNGYILATGERLPTGKEEVIISDGHYEVFEYQDIPKPKEIHVKTYKFLGIPFGKRTTYIYDKN